MWVAYIAQPESLQPLELDPFVTLVSARKEVLHSARGGGCRDWDAQRIRSNSVRRV